MRRSRTSLYPRYFRFTNKSSLCTDQMLENETHISEQASEEQRPKSKDQRAKSSPDSSIENKERCMTESKNILKKNGPSQLLPRNTKRNTNQYHNNNQHIGNHFV